MGLRLIISLGGKLWGSGDIPLLAREPQLPLRSVGDWPAGALARSRSLLRHPILGVRSRLRGRRRLAVQPQAGGTLSAGMKMGLLVGQAGIRSGL